MKIYGVFGTDGRPIGFYNDETHKQIPTEAKEITESDYRDYLTGKWLYVGRVKTPNLEAQPRDPEVAAAELTLIQTEKQMARMTEDLVLVLIDKGVIKKTDLPVDVISILDSRKEARLKIK